MSGSDIRPRCKGFQTAVYWIALNDAPGDDDALDVETVSGYVSTLLVADLFGVPESWVAARVVAIRKAGK